MHISVTYMVLKWVLERDPVRCEEQNIIFTEPRILLQFPSIRLKAEKLILLCAARVMTCIKRPGEGRSQTSSVFTEWITSWKISNKNLRMIKHNGRYTNITCDGLLSLASTSPEPIFHQCQNPFSQVFLFWKLKIKRRVPYILVWNAAVHYKVDGKCPWIEETAFL